MNEHPQEKTAAKSTETAAEKRARKIAQLKAKLQKEEALQKEGTRKERNGQLVALGVLVEVLYKSGGEDGRKQWQNEAKTNLKDRNLERVLAAFSRLDGEVQPDRQAADHQPDGQD